MSVTHGLNLRFGSWEARYKMAHDDEQSRPSPYDYSVSASRRCRVKECGPRRYVATLRMGPHVFYGFGPVPDVAVTDLLDRMLTNDPIYMVDLDGVGEIPPAWAATMAPQFVIPQEKVH